MKTTTHKKLSTISLALALVTAASLMAYTVAQADTTYYYVNTDGELEAEMADSSNEAINEAEDRKSNSGVISADAYAALMGEPMNMTDDDEAYLYVSTDGSLEAEMADSSNEAINEAEDRKQTSGVIEAEAYAELVEAGFTDTTTDDDNAYLYVASDGSLEVEMADSSNEAINEAEDRKSNSGVISAEAYAELVTK